MQWDLSTLVALGIQSVFIIVALAKTYYSAEDAKKMAEDASEKADLLSASVSLLRQHVAEQYVDKPAMREMETRITNAINRVGDQLNTYLSRRAPD